LSTEALRTQLADVLPDRPFRIVLWDIGQGQLNTIMFQHQVKSLADHRQHAQTQHIDLEDAQVFEVVLVPFYLGTVFHPGIQYRAKVG